MDAEILLSLLLLESACTIALIAELAASARCDKILEIADAVFSAFCEKASDMADAAALAASAR